MIAEHGARLCSRSGTPCCAPRNSNRNGRLRLSSARPRRTSCRTTSSCSRASRGELTGLTGSAARPKARRPDARRHRHRQRLRGRGDPPSFRGTSGVRVAGYVDGRRPCGAAVAEARPDVVIVDEMTWSANAVDRISEVRRAVPSAKIVVLTAEADAHWLGDAVRAGADAAIAKTVQPNTLGALVREIWAARSITPSGAGAPPYAPTPRTGSSLPARWRSSGSSPAVRPTA